VASMNHRLKRMGVNAAEEFSNRLNDVISQNEDASY